MSQRPLLIVAPRLRAHELFLFAAQIVLGAGYLVTVPSPPSLAALVPHWLVIVWSVGLLVSGLVGVTAAGLPYSRRTLDFERGALLISTGSLFLIGGASAVSAGMRAFFGIMMIAAWSGANLVRVWQIRGETHRLTKTGP